MTQDPELGGFLQDFMDWMNKEHPGELESVGEKLQRTQRGEYQMAEGRRLVNVHNPAQCEGRGCSVHHPSSHKMRNWPKDFLFPEDQPSAWGYFMRYCQHKVGHPDPDDITYWAGQGRDITEHTCDNCCREDTDLW